MCLSLTNALAYLAKLKVFMTHTHKLSIIHIAYIFETRVYVNEYDKHTSLLCHEKKFYDTFPKTVTTISVFLCSNNAWKFELTWVAGFTKTSYELLTNVLQTSYELATNFL